MSLRNRLKTLFPPPLVAVVSDWRRVESGARLTVLRLAWRRRRTTIAPGPIAAPGEILTVCHGNILRSPFTAALLERRLPATRIRSAGLHASNGRPADPRGIAAAASVGIDLTTHRATNLTEALVATADLILVMDRRNEAELIARHPSAAPRVVLLGGFAVTGGADPAVIPDPFTGDTADVAAAFARIETAVDGLVGAITASRTNPSSP